VFDGLSSRSCNHPHIHTQKGCRTQGPRSSSTSPRLPLVSAQSSISEGSWVGKGGQKKNGSGDGHTGEWEARALIPQPHPNPSQADGTFCTMAMPALSAGQWAATKPCALCPHRYTEATEGHRFRVLTSTLLCHPTGTPGPPNTSCTVQFTASESPPHFL